MRNLPSYLLLITSALYIPAIYAQDGGTEVEDDLSGVEMDVLESDQTAAEASANITLPESASSVAVENSANGLQTANEARAGGAEFGQSVAEQNRDSARDRGRESADAARPDAQPERPELPTRPEVPTRP